MHPKAKKAIQRKLKTSFQSCNINNGFIDFNPSVLGVEEFLDETLKHIDGVSYLGLLYAVQNFVDNNIKGKFESFEERNEYNANLDELFQEQAITDLAEEIVSYFSGLPQ